MKDKNDCMQVLIIGRFFTDLAFVMYIRSIRELMIYACLNIAFTSMMMLLTVDNDDGEV